MFYRVQRADLLEKSPLHYRYRAIIQVKDTYFGRFLIYVLSPISPLPLRKENAFGVNSELRRIGGGSSYAIVNGDWGGRE